MRITTVLPVGQMVRLILHAGKTNNQDQGYQLEIKHVIDEQSEEVAIKSLILTLRRGHTVLRKATIVAPVGEQFGFIFSRAGHRLSSQVNDLPPVYYDEIFPSDEQGGFFAISLSPGSRLISCAGYQRQEPQRPSPLEEGDALFRKREFAEALDFYRKQQTTVSTEEDRAACNYKAGLALLELHREDEARQAFKIASKAASTRWGVLGASQNWLLELKEGDDEGADAILNSILAGRFTFEDLAALLPSKTRNDILSAYASKGTGSNYFVEITPVKIRNLERVFTVQKLLGRSYYKAWLSLMRALWVSGDIEKATSFALKEIDLLGAHGCLNAVPQVSWLLRSQGRSEEALHLINKYANKNHERNNISVINILPEKARVELSLGRNKSAEQTLKQFFEFFRQRRKLGKAVSSHTWIQACLLKGQLLFEAGKEKEAMAIWRAGYYNESIESTFDRSRERTSRFEKCSGVEAIMLWVTGSRAGLMTTKDSWKLASLMVPAKGLFVLQQFPSKYFKIAACVWKTPNGIELTSRFARLDVDIREFGHLPGKLVAIEGVRDVICGGEFLEGERIILDKGIEKGLSAYINKKLGITQLILLYSSFKGVIGDFGWKDVAPTMEPDLRLTVAYFMWRRHRMVSGPTSPEAIAFRKTIKKDAPKKSTVWKLFKKIEDETRNK